MNISIFLYLFNPLRFYKFPYIFDIMIYVCMCIRVFLQTISICGLNYQYQFVFGSILEFSRPFTPQVPSLTPNFSSLYKDFQIFQQTYISRQMYESFLDFSVFKTQRPTETLRQIRHFRFRLNIFTDSQLPYTGLCLCFENRLPPSTYPSSVNSLTLVSSSLVI